MANAQKGRIACVDLDDDRARALFSDALPLAKRLGDLLPYPELSFRRRGRWSDLYKHRGFLSDAFKASEGYLLRQRVLHKQMADFSRNRDIAGSPAEIEALCYRIRAMMSHLREAKLKAFKIPERFESLSATLFHVKISPPLLDGVSLKDGDGMGLKDRIVEYDDDDDQGDLSNDVEEMTPQIFKRPSSNCVLKKPAANKGKTECIDGKKSEGIKSKTDIECILVKSLKKSL